MPQIARILLVEPEQALRRSLDLALDGAGYEVASVADDLAASALLHDGLHPDIVLVAASLSEETKSLRALAPFSLCLRIGTALGNPSSESADVADCSPEPEEVVEKVEEMLLGHSIRYVNEDRSRSLDLVSRLANAMPRATNLEERIETLTHAFDAFFGVHGTLVRHRESRRAAMVEANRGLSDATTSAIVQEIERRSSERGVRPFLTEIPVDGVPITVACVAIQLGDDGVDLALVLERRPSTRGRADALMSVIGSVMRAATNAERLRWAESAVDGFRSGFEGLLRLSRRFASHESFDDLTKAVFSAMRRDLAVTRVAFYTRRDSSQGLLDLRAATGFDSSALDRLGLSSFHGIGKATFESKVAVRLSTLTGDAVPQEFRKLFESGLHWSVPIFAGTERYGLLLFGGGSESDGRLVDTASHSLDAIAIACGLAFENLDRLSRLRESREGAWRSLVAALELRRPGDKGHSDRVAGHAARIGRAIGLSSRALDELELAARLHDVGKIHSSGEDAAGRRSHPIRGSQVLSSGGLSEELLQGIEQHHERWDGAGSPYGLRASGIHLNARIIAVANAYDHLRHDAQDAVSRDEALHRLALGAGLTLDPGIVAVFSSEIDRNPDRRGADPSEGHPHARPPRTGAPGSRESVPEF